MTPEPFPSWDDFRFFLATTKAGSFSKAANDLGVTQPTISRRIENLEQRLGVRLFDRLPSGVDLTTKGESILDAAYHIEKAVFDIHRNVAGADTRLQGLVRISVTDGLASYWMTPQLRAFHDKNPEIAIEFLCSIDPADVLNMESDLSIRFRMPEAPDLITVKLGTLHFVPWASPEYLERYGTPRKPEDLARHRLLDHFSYYNDEGDWNDWFALARTADLICYRTTSSSAMLHAIQAGLGIGMLTTYARDCAEGIVPLDLGVRTHSNIWLTYHPDIQSAARIRAVIDWVRSIFDATHTPWFSEEFQPPWDQSLKSGFMPRGKFP